MPNEDSMFAVSKIADGAIESGTIDPTDPMYVHTLIVWALKKIGMSPEEAARYATAHQEQAVEAHLTAEK
jgi:hypothetical protein